MGHTTLPCQGMGCIRSQLTYYGAGLGDATLLQPHPAPWGTGVEFLFNSFIKIQTKVEFSSVTLIVEVKLFN